MTATHTRLRAVDIGRGLAVFLMVFVHTLWMYADIPTQTDSLLGHVVHFLGKGSAAFLMCMGISMVLARQQTLLTDIKRALMLFAVGTFMNTLKFVVPISVFGTMPENFIEAYGWQSPVNGDQLLWLALTGDILQLAGFALVFVGLIRRYVQNPLIVLLAALVIAAFSRELSGIRIDVPGLYYVSELLFGGTYHVYFPVVPWMSFILIGLYFGMRFKQKDITPRQLFKDAGIIGLPSLLIGGGLCFWYPEYNFGNFFHLGPGGVIYLAGINLVLVWGIDRLVSQETNNRVTQALEYLSRRVTTIYIIQWVLICWGMSVIGFQTLNPWQTAAMMPVMLVITLATQWMLEKSPALVAPLKSSTKPANNM